jgi:hypothetical protein
MKTKTDNIDPGKLRSLQRVTSSDGYFLICALDHLSDFQELLNRDISQVSYQQTGEAKIELVQRYIDFLVVRMRLSVSA